jgi:GT2 family glycosyltransferase
MISVIIPTYKNRGLFLKNLKDNLRYLNGCEVIVINDDPSESLQHDLEKSGVKLIENQTNLGFGQSINMGVKIAKGRYLFLLNNDVILENDNYKQAIKHFENDSSLFAVSFAQKEKDGSIVGKNMTYWQKGFFKHKKANDLKYGDNGWAEGGSCIIDKNKFLELGGFNPVYSPFYWEDIDLSYRGRKKGWKILFTPEIILIHYHQSTIGKYFTQDKVKEIAFRNQLLFIWKNVIDRKTIIEHLRYLPITILNGGLPFIKGFFKALFKLI